MKTAIIKVTMFIISMIAIVLIMGDCDNMNHFVVSKLIGGSLMIGVAVSYKKLLTETTMPNRMYKGKAL